MVDFEHIEDCIADETTQILQLALVRLHTHSVVLHLAVHEEGPALHLTLVALLKVEPVCKSHDHTSKCHEVEEHEHIIQTS